MNEQGTAQTETEGQESDTQEVAAAKKSKTEYTEVELTDGRKVSFAGKRKLLKETLIDESKIAYDAEAGMMQIENGAISVRMDFRNGQTRHRMQLFFSRDPCEKLCYLPRDSPNR